MSPDSKTFTLEGKALKLLTSEDIQEHVKAIKALDSLEVITLCGNTVGVDASKDLAEALRRHTSLKKLLFSDIFTGRLRSEIPKSLEYFTNALSSFSHLTVIDFSDNAFGPDGIRPLVPLISECVSLEEIKLNNTGLGPQGGLLLADALLNAAEKNAKLGKESNLRTLVCGRSRLENGSMKKLSEALQKHKHLKVLHFPQDGIRPEGIVDLLAGLEKCTSLEVLDLQDNTFTEKGAKALAKALPAWPKLKTLNVGDCMLTKKGCIAAVSALKQLVNKELEVINFQYCEMDEKGALLLASFLYEFKNLKHLELNGNFFEEDGAGANAVRSALRNFDTEDILGSLSDMEEDDEEEDEEEEESEDEGEKPDKEADDLAAAMEKVHVEK